MGIEIMAEKVKTDVVKTVRKLGCLVMGAIDPTTKLPTPLNGPQCAEYAQSKATAWGGQLRTIRAAGGKPGNKVIGGGKLNDGVARLFIVSMDDPNFVAVYPLEFLATDCGKLFTKLSASRDRATFDKVLIGEHGVRETPDRIWSGKAAPEWKKVRASGNAAAQRSGCIVLLPMIASLAATYNESGRGAAAGTVTIGADAISAAMADCE